MSPKNFFIAILLGIALAAGIFVAARVSTPDEPDSAFMLPSPSQLPAFSLLDQFGSKIDASVFRGQWDLVFFGFTNCPDICPTTLQILASARRELSESGRTELPRIVLVSVDPEQDTPEALAQYVAYFGSDNLGITGDLAQIEALTKSLGIYFAKVPVDDGTYTVDHSAAVLLLDRNGDFTGLFSGPHTVESFVNDLPLIMDRY